MAEATERTDGWPEEPQPAPQLETVDDRLRRLEQAVAQLAGRGPAPRVTPNGLATAYGGLVPAAVTGTLVPMMPPEPPAGEAGFWGRFAIWRELQFIFRMYFDPRYRLSRACQLVAPALLVLMVLNYLAFSFWNVPVLAPVFERLILIVLAVALYKVLSREAARYDAVLKYLSQYGR
jgi:hypothetical protein